jgi:tetratricopeptide (TPR) repeat protein
MAEEDARQDGAAGNLANAAILFAASREKADSFVDKQNELADLQIEDLKRENRVRHWSLRIRHVSDVLKLGFELAVVFIVVAIAVGLGVVIWQAAHADGLVIESFDVPQGMAQKGLTGQVIASKLLDRLTVMQNQTDSSRGASSFANDWTNDIKVEIPDTGVSLGQIVRFLDGWLGHQMHLSGELYETPSGVALTVRMENEPGQTFEGNAADESAIAQLKGDYLQASAKNVMVAGGTGGEYVVSTGAFLDVSMHDGAAARKAFAALDDMHADDAAYDADSVRAYALMDQKDWLGTIALLEASMVVLRREETRAKGWFDATSTLRIQVLPQLAYAHAMLSEFDKADTIFKTLPQDCDICLRYRGKAEAARRNWSAAAHWFSLVSARSPDIPLADTDWGTMLLSKGDLDGAIAKFESGHKKGPHFADPLEMWGEALIAKNRSDLALVKFEEANRYAPSWKRLHQKWGEALGYLGRKDEVEKQFALARSLDG